MPSEDRLAFEAPDFGAGIINSVARRQALCPSALLPAPGRLRAGRSEPKKNLAA